MTCIFICIFLLLFFSVAVTGGLQTEKRAMLRCRKCRKVVIECLHEGEVTNESSEAACNIWHMDVDKLPEWILNSVHLAQWTVGRLNCQNCGARLGGFNFIHRSECPCGRDATVHFSKCRVDRDHKQNLLIVRPRWSRPDKRQLLTEGSQAKHERPERNKSCLQPLPDPGEASQVMSTEDSADRSTPSPVLYPIDKDDEATISAVTGCSSVSTARQMPLECQIVPSEEEEGSSAENAQEEGSLSLRGTSISYSSAEQEEEIVPGSLPASTALNRRSKREKNHLKSQRRKQRRREKWLQKQASSLSDMKFDGEEEEEEGDKQGLTCAVCLDVYFHPYSCQPCNHVFCEPCLRRLAKNQEQNTPCPLCRAVISHTKFHTELSRKVEASFPTVYRARKQYFKNASCVKWPLPSCRKPFHNLWGYRRNAVRAHRSWHLAHLGFTLQTFNLSDVCDWFFDIGLAIVYTPYTANWMLAFLFLAMSMYYVCI